jgi:phage gp36-like protein
MYITINDLYNYLDQIQVVACSDDFATGAVNMDIINSIMQMACDKADSLVSSIYDVPFTGPIPVKIRTASAIFAVEMLLQRRLTPDEKNYMKPQADMLRKELMDINRGLLSLDYQATRAFTPVIVRGHYNRADANVF